MSNLLCDYKVQIKNAMSWETLPSSASFILGSENNKEIWHDCDVQVETSVLGTSDYETQIVDFLSVDLPNTHRILVIRGAIGSGKSTMIRHFMCFEYCTACNKNKNRKCTPVCIMMDLLPETKESRLLVGEENYDVWRVLEAAIGQHANKLLTAEKQVMEFWPWCLRHYGKIEISKFRRVLRANRWQIERGEEHLDNMLTMYTSLHNDMNERECVFYWLTLLQYYHGHVIKKSRNGCNTLVIDNVDQLHPYCQSQVFAFAEKCASVFTCKVLLLMRPMTMAMNRSAVKGKLKEDHIPPDLLSVVKKRVDYYSHAHNSETGQALQSLFNRLSSNNINRSTLYNTSADGIRLCLESLFDLTQSPFLPISSLQGDVFHKDNMNHSVFDRAFFCATDGTNKGFLNHEHFENLFMVSSELLKNRPLAKLRILHLLISLKGVETLAGIIDFMRLFGIPKETTIHAINDMLVKSRALVWSEATYEYTPRGEKTNGSDRIMITKRGRNYYSSLLGNPHYLRECLFDIETKRHAKLEDWLRELKTWLHVLVDNDKLEVTEFIRQVGKRAYGNLFPTNGSIMTHVWELAGKRLALISSGSDVVFDAEYENYLLLDLKKLTDIGADRGIGEYW